MIAKEHNRATTSWVPGADGSGFGLTNLPLGVVRRNGDSPRPAVRIGEFAIELAALSSSGLLDELHLPGDIFSGSTLNPFLALPREDWSALRARLVELLSTDNSEFHDAGLAERALMKISELDEVLPIAIGDYVDFYSSIEHASNLGKMFRPDSEPLLPNWRHLPVAYHGRSSSVVVSDTPVRRPCGQLPPQPGSAQPSYGPSERLDIELELGFVTGPGNELGTRIPVTAAQEHIFGLVLVNDWSAREIQRWEYQPLGPFLGKSFATSISPWIVPLQALQPFRVAGPKQNPEPLPYLRCDDDWAFDIQLEVALKPAGSETETVLSRTNSRGLYWNIAQQLAHATINGTNVRPGDLYASGTISGPQPDSLGSLIEVTWAGSKPIELPGGETRVFLQDGDTVTLRGYCDCSGEEKVSFGEVSGTITPAI